MTSQGTPKTLDEAIVTAMCVGPLAETADRLYFSVRDFLAQSFGAAMLGSPELEEQLHKLFEQLTKRGHK